MDTGKKSLFQKIIDDLTARIQEGQYQFGEQLPTELELADLYNVSRITSRRALEELSRDGIIYRQRGQGSFVARKSAEIKPLGENHTIVALVMPFSEDVGNASRLIFSLTSILGNSNVWLTIHNSHNDINEEHKIIYNLLGEGIQSIIIYPVSQWGSLDLIFKLHLMNINLIVLDKYFDPIVTNYILSDNFDGGYQAANHLIQLGHKHIRFVTNSGLQNATTIRDRILGFYKALWENGIDFGQANICTIDGPNDLRGMIGGTAYQEWLDNGKKELENIFKDDPNVTALQCQHDYMAIFLEKASLSMGIAVPGDLSIVGFDNNILDDNFRLEVPLTTVAQDLQKIGELAAKKILDLLQGGGADPKRIILPVELIQRGSSAPAKK